MAFDKKELQKLAGISEAAGHATSEALKKINSNIRFQRDMIGSDIGTDEANKIVKQSIEQYLRTL